MSNVLRARAVLGHAARTGDPGRVADARRDLAAANLEQYIGRITADAPPLTAEQRDHLAALIREGASA